jgi:hypothetical protein
MNYFWGNVFDYFKDRRIAGVFFGTMLALGGVLVAGVILWQIICAYQLEGYLIYTVPGWGLLVGVWLWRVIRQWRAWRKVRYRSAPLSRDELAKARSKLISHKTTK